MNEKTLQKLEYDKIMAMLRKECSSALGMARVDELLPSREFAEVQSRQQASSEGREILMMNPTFNLGGVRNITESVSLARKNGILDGPRLLDIQSTARAGRRIKLTLTQLKGDYPLVKALAERIHFVNSLESAIDESIGDDGAVLDSASRELADIRRRIRNCNDRVKEKLEGLIRNPNNSKYLQDPIVTIRNERYVVPVKQEYRNQIPGLIHDQSSSGATLFIEPMSVLELNNDLRRLRGDEEDEVNRILTRLSALVADNGAELKENLDVLGELDFIFAKGRLSLLWNGFAPQLNNEGRLRLRQARHPLLGDGAVPIDLEMGTDLDGIVITGPNTGGKTVSLKIAGLFVLMAQAGLHLPTADRCEVAVFRGVYADIGDEQSIEQSLSTFSSHMVNIVNILAKAGRNNLVVLDELGAGTDPVEGAALAQAIIDTLLQKGSRVIVTTHYSELKAYAYNHPRLANASVEFDIDTLKPTYRLLMGIPGRSNAFDIALSLGVDAKVIARADNYRSKEAKEVADFLANLEEGRVQTERAREEARALKARLEVLEREMAGREESLKLREAQIIEKAQFRADKLVRDKRREAETLVRELKELVAAQDMHSREVSMKQAREKVKRIEEMGGDWQEEAPVFRRLDKVSVGDEVYLPRLKKNAVVLAVLSDKEVQVQSGIMKVNMKLSDLARPEKSEQEIQRSSHARLAQAKAKEVKTELDLRGLSGEEAQMELEKFLDDVSLANLPTIRIIHGLGTGVLKKMVHDYLARDKRIKTQRLGGYYEGGAGVTIAELA